MPIASKRCHLVFQKMERDLLKLASSQEPERVHSFRTTARRLQTLLEELIRERGRNQKKLLKLLDQIRKRAGKVRDLDVQLAALHSLKIAQEPRRKTQLTHSVIELRAKHEHKLRKTLTKDNIRDIRKRLRRGLREMRADTNRDPLVVAREILAQVRGSEATLTEEVLHRYRIAVKRARYAAEFAAASTEAAQFITALKRLQDALGDWHDWLTLTHTAAARLGDVNQSSLVAALHNVTGGKFRHAVAALTASLAALPALKPVLSTSSEHPRKSGAKTTLVARTDSAA